MSDEPAEFKWNNWSANFPFTQLFRTFRMAIHPPKLGLALSGVILTILCGRILDAMWSRSSHLPVKGEINAFWYVSDLDQWRKAVKDRQFNELVSLWVQIDKEKTKDLDKLRASFDENPNQMIKQLQGKIKTKYEEMKLDVSGDKEEIRAQARKYNDYYRRATAIKPDSIFGSYISYEKIIGHRLFDAACTLNFTGRLGDVLHKLPHQALRTGTPNLDGMGVIPCLLLMVRGEQWMAMQHPVYYVIFAVIFLVIWSAIGGAICRMAALHFARDERISFKSALEFTRRKFIGFLTAPLLPLGMILGVGILLCIGGLLGAIPILGEIIAGLGMGLALLGGFVMALIVVGFIAGGSLLWPTIAVEGSDGFDAMSRSYSYVYSKPWRTIFYAIVATIYGALCYMFVRFFVFIILAATRLFVGIGMFPGRPGMGVEGATKIDAIWPMPTFGNLRPPVSPLGMQGLDGFAAFLIGIWVLIAVSLICAFLVSFYFSGSTIIYFLLRREVDATDMEDVYIEEEQEIEEETGTTPVPTPEEESPAPPPENNRPPAEQKPEVSEPEETKEEPPSDQDKENPSKED